MLTRLAFRSFARPVPGNDFDGFSNKRVLVGYRRLRMTPFSPSLRLFQCLFLGRAVCGSSVQYLPTVVANSAKQFRGSQLALSQRAAASAVSSGRVLNAMDAFGAALCTVFTTVSSNDRLFGGSRIPPPITTQS